MSLPMSTYDSREHNEILLSNKPRGSRVRNDKTSGATHVKAAAQDLLRIHARTVAAHTEQRTDVINAARRAGLTWDEIALLLGYGSGEGMRVAHLRAGGER